jgi:hypothetical protein
MLRALLVEEGSWIVAEEHPSKTVPKGHDVESVEIDGDVRVMCECGWVGTRAEYAGDGGEAGHVWSEGVVKAKETE